MDRILPVEGAAAIEAAKALFRDYAGTPGIGVCLGGFEREVASLPGRYAPPDGGLLLAEADGVPAGIIALCRHSDGGAELRRLYLRPAFRGRGLGRRLAEEALALAEARGFSTVCLETLESMAEAVALYRSLGFEGPMEPGRPGMPMRFEKRL